MPALDHRDKTYQTADELRERLRSGVYSANTFLPPERKLAEELQVARTTLRSALGVLEDERLISRQSGRGALVRERAPVGLGGIVPLLVQQHVEGGLAPFSPELMALVGGALSACAGSDIRFLVHAMPPGGVDGLVDLVRANHAPGVLFVECDDAATLASLRDAGIPYAVINQEHDIPGPATRVDVWGVGRGAAEYLLDMGHRRLGVLAGPTERHMYERMLAGFRGRAAEAECYLEAENVVAVESCSEASRSAALEMLGEDTRPTALFCTRDVRAYGAFLAARELGLDVPVDLSLVGYDNITWPGEGRDFLTTFPEPTEALGRGAIELLSAWIETGVVPEDRAVSPEIIVRQSAAPPTG